MLMLTFCLSSHKCDESTIPHNCLLTFAGAVNLLSQGFLLLVVSLELRGVEHLAVHLEHPLGAHRLLAQHSEVTNHKILSLSIDHHQSRICSFLNLFYTLTNLLESLSSASITSVMTVLSLETPL